MGRRGQLIAIENRRLALVSPILDAFSSWSALVEQNADGELGSVEHIFSAAEPDRVTGRDRLLSACDRCKQLRERLRIGVIARRVDVDSAAVAGCSASSAITTAHDRRSGNLMILDVKFRGARRAHRAA